MTPLEPLVLIPGAFVAGLLMFLAPCTLPIVPGYLLYIAGVPQEGATQGKRRIVSNAVAFVLGFSLVFVFARYSFTYVDWLVAEDLSP